MSYVKKGTRIAVIALYYIILYKIQFGFIN